MKVELSKKEEIVVSLAIAAIFGGLLTGFVNYGYSYGLELNAFRADLSIQRDQSVSAQSLRQGTSSSTSFPPPLYVLEWIQFDADIYNVSGGSLEINFTRDGAVLHTERISNSWTILLSGYDQYRLRSSNLDVVLTARGDDVRIGSLIVNINRGLKSFNPLLGAVSLTVFVGVFIVPFALLRKTQR